MRRRHTRRIFSLFSIFLLTLSLILPAQASSQQVEPNHEDLDEEALEVIKELEAEAEKEATDNEDESTSVDANDSSVPGLTDGVDFDDGPAYDEENFVQDGMVESDIVEKFTDAKTVDVIIRLKDKVDMNELSQSALTLDAKTDRAEYVVNSLQNKSETSQVDLLQTLDGMEAAGTVSNVKSFWVFNGVSASVTEEALDELATRDDVERITLDAEIQAPEFTPEESEPNLPAYGVESINAPKVWGEYDYRGEGTVVGIMDSGVQGDHEALKDSYRGRDGDGDSSWLDVSGENYDVPSDGLGHGTHVAGSAVGGGEGDPIGVAPDAEWIAAKIFDDGGRAPTSGIHEAFEWFLAPGGDPEKAPDVVNNSWGNANTYETEFYEGVIAWVAAGIFPLFSGGNDGPGGGTIGSPGSFPEAYSIGATDQHDQIAPFSSRGPVYWEDDDGVEQEHIKPEISAPGVEIYSALPDGGYGLNSGTSMASPHAAGAIALIKGNDPTITDTEVMDLLENTARVGEHMGSTPNNDYGHGVIDVYQAVTENMYAGQLTGSLTDTEGEPIAGELYFKEEDLQVDVKDDGMFDVQIREGEHEIVVSSFGYQSTTETIEIVKGEVVEKDWSLQQADRHNVSGTISFTDGEPASLVSVRVKDTPVQMARADENGEFHLSDIPEGEFTLVFSGQGIKSVSKDIHVTEDMSVNVEVERIQIEADADWRTSRNNYARNAITNAEVSADNLSLDWTVNVSTGMSFNSPVIAEGKVVYVSNSGRVTVIDQHTGEEDWSMRTGISNRSTPTVEDGVIYVGGGGDFSLHAISLETGLKKWTKSLNYPAIYETPILKDGVLYISSHMDPGAKATALDAETGDTIWEQEIGDGAFFGPAMSDDSLFVSTYDSKELFALAPDTGDIQWQTQLTEAEGFSSSPVYADGYLYAHTNHLDDGVGSLRAFDASSGEKVWHVEGIGNGEAGAPIVFDDLVITGSKSQAMIRAYDAATGELAWEAENGSPMSTSGAVSGDGNLFITDTSSHLKVYDASTGERLASYGLTDSSIAGVALSDGQVIAADNSGIYSFTAPGKLTGTITDEDGEPLEATISVPETGQTTETDENGEFSLEENPGDYEVKVAAYGYQQVVEEVTFISGYERNITYALGEAELGSFSGKINDATTESPLEDVTVSIKENDQETTTDADGTFTFSEVYEGTYDVELSYSGYREEVVSVTIEADEHTDENFTIQPIEVAVLHDFEDEIVRFLNNNDIVAEERDWSIVDDIEDYEVIVLNGAYTSDGEKPTEKQIDEITAAAKEADVSLLFAGTWGPSYGSLRYLAEHTGDPATYDSEMGSGETVHLRVDQSHPIFEGLEEDSTHMTIDRNYLAWFNQYSGQTIGSTGTSDQGIVGSGVAYKGMTENSAHLLMSTHAVSPWVSPYVGWTSVQQQVYLNGINYLLDDTQFGEVSGTVVDSEDNPVEDVTITVEDTGLTAETDADGAYELFHDDGTYEVSFRKNGYSTKTTEVEFVHNEPQTADFVLAASSDGTVSGQVVNTVTNQEVPHAEITVYDSDHEEVTTASSSQNGNYEITGLEEATYTLEVTESDFVVYEQTVDVGSEPIAMDIELYPIPNLGIIGDSSIRGLAEALADKGIDATNYTEMEEIIPEISNYDVVFFNAESIQDKKKATLEELLVEADKHEVSIIFGDEYYTGSGLNHLVENLQDPETRNRVRDKSTSAGYVITEENPIFGDAEEGDFVRILNPGGSSVSAFENYTGYPLADITHDGSDETHGEGVAYKPRTGGSMELLMGGHGISPAHRADDYTEEGMDMFLNAVLWSAYTEFNAIEGEVTDENGNPLDATVTLVDQGMEKNTDLETGEFEIGSINGEFEIEVQSFGYDTYTETVTVDDNLEPMTIEMTAAENVGSIQGTIIDEETHQGIDGVNIHVEDQPRDTATDVSGSFTIETLEPGDYELIIQKDDYVLKEIDVIIEPGETVTIEEAMKPTPTIGVIVDSQSSRAFTLDEYLTPRGYDVEELYYTDVDEIENMDLIFANSDYDNDLIPEEDDFKDFLTTLDRTETPVIWTGNNGPRGSIRFLEDYIGDPEVENVGRLSSDDELTVTVTEDHPILDRVTLDDNNQFTFPTGYYGGFEGYTGTTIADVASDETGDLGGLIGFGGRTLNSNEVLLETMTFGYGFSEDEYFDDNREKIINNAITWLLDEQEPLVGEIHGQVTNDLDGDVSATVTVEETDYTFDTEQDGSFFLALDDGTYTLEMEAFGHESESFDVTIERGEVLDETFTMTAENAGTVTGEVTDETTGEAIEDAEVSVEGTPISATSDADGSYEVQAPAGDYQIRVTAAGYTPVMETVEVVKDETIALDFSLTASDKIAFVGRSVNEDRALPFLEKHGYEADFYESDQLAELKEKLAEYPLVIWNDNSAPEGEFTEFIDEADNMSTSIIFASQYNNGTIRDLNNFYNDPADENSSFASGYVDYKVLENHPIFSGYEKGDTITIADRGDSNQQYHVFENYSGTTIADLEHYEDGRLGSAVAYDYRTADSVHVLLDTLHIGSYGNPDDRWTEDAEKIYVNAIDWAISAGRGEIEGTVKNEDGEPIADATVSIDTENIDTTTNEDGAYSLAVGVGEYEVTAGAPGYEHVTETVTIENLEDTVELNFTLTKTDRASLTGKVVDDDNEGIEDVAITLIASSSDFEETVETDQKGSYEFLDLVADDYEMVVEAKGYQTIEETLTLAEGEHKTKDFTLGEYDIAVIGDFKDDMTSLLTENDLYTQSRDWDITEDVYNYNLIIVNSSKGTDEQIETLIDEADKYETSLVFVDTWGTDGSIEGLGDVLGNPELDQQGYDEGAVYVTPSEDHEVFEDFDEEEIKVHSEKSPYATFKDYEGTSLATLTVDGEDQGTTMAYDFRGENHMHLLLSSYAVNNMIGPGKGWTEDGEDLFLSVIEWAQDAETDMPGYPEWMTEGPILTNETTILVEGKVARNSTAIIKAGDDVLAETEPERDGTFEVELTDLADGHYELVLVESSDDGDHEANETLEVIIDTVAPDMTIDYPTDGERTNKEVVTVEGTVVDENLDYVEVNGQKADLDGEKYSKRMMVDQGENVIEVTAVDIVGNTTTESVTIDVKYDAPEISNLTPDEDKNLETGQSVKIEFDSEPGLRATFVVRMPLTDLGNDTALASNPTELPMMEMPNGKYVGYWTVPANVQADGAKIEVKVQDRYENETREKAAGKLFINLEK